MRPLFFVTLSYLWVLLPASLTDIRSRVEVSAVGTPLTHQRFLVSL